MNLLDNSGLWCTTEQDLADYEAYYGEPPEWVQEAANEHQQRLENLKTKEEKNIEEELDRLVAKYVSQNEKKLIGLAAKKHEDYYFEPILIESPLRIWKFHTIPGIDAKNHDGSGLENAFKYRKPGYQNNPDTPRCVEKSIFCKKSQTYTHKNYWLKELQNT